MLQYKQRSNIAVEERLTNEGRHHLVLLYKQAHDKRGIAESQHAYINRALRQLDVRYFHKNITTLYNTPTPSFEEPQRIF